MNEFIWPPAEPSDIVLIARPLYLDGVPAEQQTLGTVSERLESSLVRAGYIEYGYQSIACSGFAMVTRLEPIDAEGRRLVGDARFPEPETSPNWSLRSYIQRLFGAPPGYYRQIVFAATDRPYERDNLRPPPTREQLQQMMDDANVDMLPNDLFDRPFTSGHRLYALIYEFEKGEAREQAVHLKPARLRGVTHIRRAGIFELD